MAIGGVCGHLFLNSFLVSDVERNSKAISGRGKTEALYELHLLLRFQLMHFLQATQHMSYKGLALGLGLDLGLGLGLGFLLGLGLGLGLEIGLGLGLGLRPCLQPHTNQAMGLGRQRVWSTLTCIANRPWIDFFDARSHVLFFPVAAKLLVVDT